MLKTSDNIKQVAREAAQELLNTALTTATALSTKTATDVEWIKASIERIDAKLDGKFVTKEDFDATLLARTKVTDAHQEKIDSLQQERWVTRGGLIVISMVLGWLVVIYAHHL